MTENHNDSGDNIVRGTITSYFLGGTEKSKEVKGLGRGKTDGWEPRMDANGSEAVGA